MPWAPKQALLVFISSSVTAGSACTSACSTGLREWSRRWRRLGQVCSAARAGNAAALLRLYIDAPRMAPYLMVRLCLDSGSTTLQVARCMMACVILACATHVIAFLWKCRQLIMCIRHALRTI